MLTSDRISGVSIGTSGADAKEYREGIARVHRAVFGDNRVFPGGDRETAAMLNKLREREPVPLQGKYDRAKVDRAFDALGATVEQRLKCKTVLHADGLLAVR
jgi:hypothetical protein